MAFPLAEFNAFANDLTVNTKEKGQIKLGPSLLSSQKEILRQVAKGFDDDVHDFIVLKCRQLGASTLMMAVDLFWVQRFAGTTGILVTQDDKSLNQFRQTLKLYYDGLPDDWQIVVTGHNAAMMVLENGSMLLYRVAGVKKSSGSGNLGRSAAPSFIHGTEVAKWADPEGIASLRSAMSEENPNRLYVWESTASGFNNFWNMWLAAKEAVSQRQIFVTWYHNEFYRVSRQDKRWHAYFGVSGRATEDEKRRAREVKALYGVTITPEMVAWYRWYEAEKCSGNDLMAMQEMPWTADESFVATGARYFTSRSISDCHRYIHSMPRPKYYRIMFYEKYESTRIIEAPRPQSTLEVFEEPVKGATYVMGADPAYGSSENADRFVASVWRCYADKIEQAAEFSTADLSPHQFAWLCVYLAGAYDPCTLNLEINGPGQAVDNEIMNLGKQLTFSTDPNANKLRNVLAGMRTYYYRRFDSMSSSPVGRHTISTSNVKERYLGEFKDYVERGMCTVRSASLVEEMQNFERTEGGQLEGGAKAKDDRVIAAGLAIMSWNDSIRTKLMLRGYTYDSVHSDRQVEYDPTSRVLSKYLIELGIYQKPNLSLPEGVRYGVPGSPRRRSPARR